LHVQRGNGLQRGFVALTGVERMSNAAAHNEAIDKLLVQLREL